jgi:hypothetical protein
VDQPTRMSSALLLQSQLRSVLGDRLTFNPTVLQSHGQDESYHHPVPPQVNALLLCLPACPCRP